MIIKVECAYMNFNNYGVQLFRHWWLIQSTMLEQGMTVMVTSLVFENNLPRLKNLEYRRDFLLMKEIIFGPKIDVCKFMKRFPIITSRNSLRYLSCSQDSMTCESRQICHWPLSCLYVTFPSEHLTDLSGNCSVKSFQVIGFSLDSIYMLK